MCIPCYQMSAPLGMLLAGMLGAHPIRHSYRRNFFLRAKPILHLFA
ncbi:hypothetical protein BRCON_2450 [Candidatus Sumerlaea chitinivorans]|uniref:Uncharacterized protein n=1 Tax=Sumerlaea chitinivorans TaxID=2250252 RepID=A0A2Z4Y7M0_SUMC1|nr:hypothetical protein BRCON_2450 [Candidatus Sumerlaea chitinivorans]